MALDHNLARPGTRTSQTQNPDAYKRDIDEKIRSLYADQFPLIQMNELAGVGSPPKSRKVEVMLHEGFDPWDRVTAVTMGALSDVESRYMRLSVAQVSRPQANGQMFYQPQDKFYIPSTGQTVMCVMTQNAAQVINGAEWPLTTTLSGGTTTRSLAGTIVVKNIEPAALIAFSAGEIVWIGRTIYESQNYEGISTQEDVYFDMNYVETKDIILRVSSDQMDFYERYGTIKDFDFQQREIIRRFKEAVNKSCWFGERAMDSSQTNRPMHHMRGLLKSIRTNVTMYDPTQTDDFERLVSNWMEEQLFRYNPNGNKKIIYCGSKFASNWQNAFKEYRRSDLSDKKPRPGLNIRTYEWLDWQLMLVIDGTFRTGTRLENWAVGVDPMESQLCVSKNFIQHNPTMPNERDKSLVWTWEGTMRHHREKTSAILRTP